MTGAGGYSASWIVKLLLSKGYVVHGTVRDPGDKKNAHLKKLENSENLKLFKADILDYEALSAAVAGCEGVFHAACPVLLLEVPDPEVDMIRPAVEGTLNVLKACSQAKVRRVVLVSSLATVIVNPNYPPHQVFDEGCCSDKEFCRSREYWYELAKNITEEKAGEYSKSSGLDVVTICPSFNLGPLLQETLNETSLVFIAFCEGKRLHGLNNHILHLVDVRDVANASLLIYERPEASGRYICCPYVITPSDFYDICRKLYPSIEFPDCASEEMPYNEVTSGKLERLGWEYQRLEETIKDTIEDLVSKGALVLKAKV